MSEEIIKKHCGNVEERIKACRSRVVAEQLKEHLCQELSLNCKSEIIINLLKRHVDGLIKIYFDRDGHNLSLQEKNNSGT